MMRIVPAAVFVALVIMAGCIDHSRHAGDWVAPELAIDRLEFEYKGHEVYLAPLREAGHEAVTLRVDYSCDSMPTEFHLPWFGRMEHVWLLAYLNNAALVYANGGKLPVGVSIPGEIHVPAGSEWWFGNCHSTLEWNDETLAWREGEDVVEFTEGSAAADAGNWVRMTPESYRRWYDQLDSRVGLSKRFARCGPASTSSSRDGQRWSVKMTVRVAR